VVSGRNTEFAQKNLGLEVLLTTNHKKKRRLSSLSLKGTGTHTRRGERFSSITKQGHPLRNAPTTKLKIGEGN
jgi:hypothetical protein